MFWNVFLGDQTRAPPPPYERWFDMKLCEFHNFLQSVPVPHRNWLLLIFVCGVSNFTMFKPGIIRNSLAASTNTTSADNLLSLYNKIPDYAEVKHLGHSDFVRALEKLKEEFRRVRSSLYISNEDGHLEDIDVDDVSYLESRLKILNIRDSASLSPIRRPGTALKSATGYEQGSEKSNLEVHGRQSQLHRSPTTSNYAINYLNYNKPSRSLSFVNFDRKERQNFSSDEEENNKRVDEYTSINSESCSEGSSPDLGSYAYREFKEYERKDYVPKNIEKR